MKDGIFIQSRVDGFRRCGVAHSSEGKAFPADFFDEDQIKILQEDPDIVMVAGVPEEENLKPEDTGKSNLPETGSKGAAPTPGALMSAAAQAIADGNITQSKKPTVDAMEEILGCSITASQRDQGYEDYLLVSQETEE